MWDENGARHLWVNQLKGGGRKEANFILRYIFFGLANLTVRPCVSGIVSARLHNKGDTFSEILETSITTGDYYCILKL